MYHEREGAALIPEPSAAITGMTVRWKAQDQPQHREQREGK